MPYQSLNAYSALDQALVRKLDPNFSRVVGGTPATVNIHFHENADRELSVFAADDKGNVACAGSRDAVHKWLKDNDYVHAGDNGVWVRARA